LPLPKCHCASTSWPFSQTLVFYQHFSDVAFIARVASELLLLLPPPPLQQAACELTAVAMVCISSSSIQRPQSAALHDAVAVGRSAADRFDMSMLRARQLTHSPMPQLFR
jgi:hypothetical protein